MELIRRKTGIRLKACSLQFLMYTVQRDQAMKHLIGLPNWTVPGLPNSSPFPSPTQPTTRHRQSQRGCSASGSWPKPKALVPGSELEPCSSHLIPSLSTQLLASSRVSVGQRVRKWRMSPDGSSFQCEPSVNLWSNQELHHKMRQVYFPSVMAECLCTPKFIC